MRVYFLSDGPAVLKLNGEYAGNTDTFRRFADIEGGAFAEWLSCDNSGALNFFIDERFFERPHDYVYTVTDGTEYALYADFAKRKQSAGGVFQLSAGGTLYTLFNFGAAYLACDGRECAIHPLSAAFAAAKLTAFTADGRQYLAVIGEGRAAVLDEAKIIYEGRADSFEDGQIAVKLRDCAESVRITNAAPPHTKSVRHGRAADKTVAHFALFEAVKDGSDCTPYLSDELKGRADGLKRYLGAFEAVIPPTPLAESLYGKNTVGILRREEQKKFRAVWYRTEIEDGVIYNIYPTE